MIAEMAQTRSEFGIAEKMSVTIFSKLLMEVSQIQKKIIVYFTTKLF